MPSLLLKLAPYIALVVILIGSYTVGHIKGNASCQIKDAKQETVAIKKDGDNYDTIHLKDSQLADPAFELRVAQFLRAK